MTITLFDFSRVATAGEWQAIDDRVMGGVSQSQLRAAEEHAVFEGTVSDCNNGGFASVRASVSQQVPDKFEYLWITHSGSNVHCYINLRMNDSFDGMSFRAGFNVDTAWERTELPLSIRSLNHVLAPSRHTKKTYNQGISPVIRLPSTCPRTV